jgi:hypothetical protein
MDSSWREQEKFNLDSIIIPALTNRLNRHHELYSLPCTSEYLEELVSDALKEGGIDNDWEPNRSHRVSTDMESDIGSISVKSGIVRDGYLRFSGSRLGRFKSLNERVDHIQNTRSDHYICLAKSNNFNPQLQVYQLFIFNKSTVDYSGDWVSYPHQDTLMKENMHGFIVHSMSSQLWTHAYQQVTGKPYIIAIDNIKMRGDQYELFPLS